MDADDDRYNGCELKINQGKCPFGSCENHGVKNNQQCGSWRGLYCDESTENQCCVFEGPTSHDEAVQEASKYPCGSRCHMFCHNFSDNFDECKSVCTEDIFGCSDEDSSSGMASSSWNTGNDDADESGSSDENSNDPAADLPTEISEGSGSETGSGCQEWDSDHCYMDKSCWIHEPMAHVDGGKIRHDLICGRLEHTPRVETPGRNQKIILRSFTRNFRGM